MLADMTESRDDTKRKLHATRDQARAVSHTRIELVTLWQVESLTSTVSKMAADALALDTQQRALKAMLEASQACDDVMYTMTHACQAQCMQREAEIAVLQSTVADQQSAIAAAELKAQADEIVRCAWKDFSEEGE